MEEIFLALASVAAYLLDDRVAAGLGGNFVQWISRQCGERRAAQCFFDHRNYDVGIGSNTRKNRNKENALAAKDHREGSCIRTCNVVKVRIKQLDWKLLEGKYWMEEINGV